MDTAEDIVITLTAGVRAQRLPTGTIIVYQNADATTPPSDWVPVAEFPPEHPVARVIWGMARLKDALGIALSESLATEGRIRGALHTEEWERELSRRAVEYADALDRSDSVAVYRSALIEHARPSPELVPVGAGAAAWSRYRQAAREVLRLNALVAADIDYDEQAYRIALHDLAQATQAFFTAAGVA